MAYTNNRPLATDKPSASQPILAANFASIKLLVDENHVTFDAVGQGKHKHVTFPEQGATPVTAANEVALFSRQSALTGLSELCIANEGAGAVYEFSSCLANANGWTRLPSGILLKWGTSASNGLATLVFPVAATIPAFTTVFNIQLTPVDAAVTDANIAIRLVDFTNLQFRSYGSARITAAAAAAGFTYLAIGI